MEESVIETAKSPASLDARSKRQWNSLFSD